MHVCLQFNTHVQPFDSSFFPHLCCGFKNLVEIWEIWEKTCSSIEILLMLITFNQNISISTTLENADLLLKP